MEDEDAWVRIAKNFSIEVNFSWRDDDKVEICNETLICPCFGLTGEEI